MLSSDRLACPSGPEEGRGQVGSKGDREMKRLSPLDGKDFSLFFLASVEIVGLACQNRKVKWGQWMQMNG